MILSPIPTNIITGFLGVGKTTAIIDLLKQKPSQERWAVLINEFGEIGVDGSVVESLQVEADIAIKEVPGGCMCCAAGLPMKVALNKLIQQVRPDRLLIEPTGLGHPKEVVAVLSRPEYRNVINLKSTLTLVDARHFSQTRYTEHDIFNQQLQVADVIVANKQDAYSDKDRESLQRYLLNNNLSQVRQFYTEQGRLSLGWIDLESQHQQDNWRGQQETLFRQVDVVNDVLPESGYLRKTNASAGYFVAGWRFDMTFCFDEQGLLELCESIDAVRLKASIIMADGNRLINRIDDELQLTQVDQLSESKIEIISQQKLDWDLIEQQLLKCVLTPQYKQSYSQH
jgi:G3E family GTPase